jgi:hypothetical protein
MKISSIYIMAMFSLFVLQAHAQTEAPKGFKKGSIVLADGSNLSGFVKDNMRSNAAVVFVTEAGANKKTYNGTELVSAEIEGIKFICINGDFFKVLCEGELFFLQKSSDASGKPTYNGNEAIFSSGTEGRPNDYFIYNGKDKQLKLISKKNVDEVATACFAGHNAAIEKAKNINGDLSQIKEAVEIYNNGSK